MSAFSTVGEVFSDTEFSAPGKSFLWGLCALEELNRESTGFLIMPKRPYDWRVDTHGCYKFITLHLALDLAIKLLTFLCSSTFATPIFPDPAVSCAVSKHNKEGLSADITNTSAGGDDVLDCDVAHQSHVSAHLFPSLSFICELLGASCFAPH